MARTKQATPLRRDPSSEYFSKSEADATGTPTRSPRNLDKEINGIVASNGYVAEKVIETLAPEARKEAGAVQFLIAVGGIYGSL
jgi:UDP-galactose transporter B1